MPELRSQPLNGEPMTTLERLRDALKALPPGLAVALQIQRDQKLMSIAFTMEYGWLSRRHSKVRLFCPGLLHS
jgi:hypothetical protein